MVGWGVGGGFVLFWVCCVLGCGGVGGGVGGGRGWGGGGVGGGGGGGLGVSFFKKKKR